MRPRWFAPIVLVVAVALAYANSLRAPLLFDDVGAVTRNPTIRDLGSLDVLRPPADGSTTTGRPVVNLSYALNHAISGDEVWSYHATNIAIHALAALLLFGIVARTFSPPMLAWWVALLWALHPLQTETVVCIAQRTESLCGLFYLLTLYGFIRGTRGWLIVSVVACLLGMATKEVMVTAPLLVLLYDRTFVAGTFAGAWRARRGFYFALAATWLLLGALLLSSHGARGASAGFGLGISAWHYLLQQCAAIVLYLRLAFVPWPLVLDYGDGVATSLVDVWWQGALVVGLLGYTAWALVRRPRLGFAGAAFFLLLAPSSSFVPLVTQTMAEHRMYLPLAVVVILVVLAMFRRLGQSAGWFAATACVIAGTMTVARNFDYRDAIAIWTDSVRHYPTSARAHNNLALALQEQGKATEANAQYARALELKPDYVTAHYNWGVALLAQERVADAVAQLEAAVRLAPEHADAQLNLGNALVQTQRARDAVPHFEAALRVRPAPDAHYDLGVAWLVLNDDGAATREFRAALPLPAAYYQLGRMAERAGDVAEAETNYTAALRLAPVHAASHARLGLLLARANRLPDAAAHLRTAVQLRPRDADAQVNLGNVLLLQGQVAEAVACYEAALQLRPEDATLRSMLESARAQR